MSSFDKLVSGLTDKERMEILQRMKNGSGALQLNMQVPEKLDLVESTFDIKTRMGKLSVFERIMLWVKATFSNRSIEETYNKSRVASYAHEVERQYLGLIEHRHHLMLDVFLTHLQELRSAARFFEPYINAYEKNPGSFYVLLGSIVMPVEHSDIESSADPYSYSLDEDVSPELHADLVKKLEDAINAIPDSRRKTMYSSVASVEWLRAFTRLPFERMISKFSIDDSGRKTCPYENLGKDFTDFASVMCSGKILSKESLQTLYLFSMKAAAQQGYGSTYADENQINEYLENASLQMTTISSFIKTVPTRKIACVVTNNVQFVPPPISGGEEWFMKFRSEWKILFEHKWNLWMRDYERERIQKITRAYFGYENLPLFPYRPWTSVWDGLPFRYDLSLGFTYAFFKDCFMRYLKTLKFIALEGDFAIKENRVEFTDTCNIMYRINDDLDVLATQLSAGGDFGVIFSKYEGESQRKVGDVKTVRDVIKQVENKTASILKNVLVALHSMQNLMNGILSEHVTSYYGPVMNLARIQSRDGKNKQFIQSLKECRFGVNHAYEILTALEPLELPTSY